MLAHNDWVRWSQQICGDEGSDIQPRGHEGFAQAPQHGGADHKGDRRICHGRARVVMDKRDYEDLVDARDHTAAMRDIAAGAPTLTRPELDAYLAAPTPLAFWRQRAGKTQAALADEIGVSPPFLAQIEGGQRQGTVRVLARLAKSLGVRIEDLLP